MAGIIQNGHMALYRKWRPLVFGDVFGQEPVTRALSNQVESGGVSHAYLFTGTRGTGKTTCAKILARAVNCLAPQSGSPCNRCEACAAALSEATLDITEIDAASNNGVDNIREMREEAFFAPSSLKKRVYIIDEVHMLSAGAFNALLKILEEPPAHVLFILATTEIHKVPATILSRCQRYDFRRIPAEIIAGLLENIAQAEGVTLSPDAAALLAARGDGSMRDAISLLDRTISQGEGQIGRETVESALGLADSAAIRQLYAALLEGNAGAALEIFTRCYMQGKDITSLFDELLTLIRDIYIVKATGGSRFLMGSTGEIDSVKAFAGQSDPALLEFFVSCVSDLMRRLTRTAMTRTDAEMCLLKMCLRQQGGAAVLPAEAASVPPKAVAHAPKAAVPDEELPWEAGSKADAAPAQAASASNPEAKKPDAPARAGSAKAGPPGGDSALLGKLIAQVSPHVNAAVRTYLSLGSAQNIDNTVYITVAEESLVFMNKPAVAQALETAAKALGYGGANISDSPPLQQAAAPAALAGVLSRAKGMGVKVNEINNQ